MVQNVVCHSFVFKVHVSISLDVKVAKMNVAMQVHMHHATSILFRTLRGRRGRGAAAPGAPRGRRRRARRGGAPTPGAADRGALGRMATSINSSIHNSWMMIPVYGSGRVGGIERRVNDVRIPQETTTTALADAAGHATTAAASAASPAAPTTDTATTAASSAGPAASSAGAVGAEEVQRAPKRVRDAPQEPCIVNPHVFS